MLAPVPRFEFGHIPEKPAQDVNHFASQTQSTFGKSDPSWKFPTMYSTSPGSYFGAFELTFGQSDPNWTFDK
jgi:hypothetical protein